MPEPLHNGDIAVVGLGCRFPHAPNVNALWDLVRGGKVAFEEISDRRWKHSTFYSSDVRAVDKTYATRGAFIERLDEFAALHYGIAPRRLQVTDPQHRLLVETVRDALQDAGYDSRPFDRANTGVFIGASVSEYKDILTARLRAESMVDGSYGDSLSPAEAQTVRSTVADVASVRTFTIAGSLLNMMAATVSQVFDLSGPSFTLDAACSSALVAIHEAVVHLRAQQCHVALAGGAYLNLTPDNLIGFSRLQAISPSGECRPFDARADGFVMGEGIGVVVLKRLADARRDGDRIYALIRGTGCNNDGQGEGPMTPRPEGQVDAMQRAHRDAGDFAVETIGFVESHGTATTVGDTVEIGALRTFFDTCAGHAVTTPYCYLGSIKANIGHTMSAAGVAGFIKAVLAIKHGVIPPQPSVEVPNPALGLDRSPFRLTRLPLPWERATAQPRRAAVSSFGFGGTNAHILLEEFHDQQADAAAERDELFLVSAPNDELLSQHLLELAAAVDELSLAPATVAYTLAARLRFGRRVAFVAKSRSELIGRLRQAATMPPAAPDPDRRRVFFPFPGDEARSSGLLRELAEGTPTDARALMQGPGHTLATLPPTPLERQRYWAIERTERPSREPSVANSASQDATMEGLLAAFRRQVALLEGQQTALRAQGVVLQALVGGATAPTASIPASVAAPAAKSAEAQRPSLRQAIEAHILASVARISAFPQTALRLDQVLATDLGFDSLMLVDLDENIAKEWPQTRAVPYDLLSPQTTIQDLIDHVLRALEASPATSAVGPEGAVERYVPVVVPTPLRKLQESVLIFRAPLLLTRDPFGFAEALAIELERRGVSAQIGEAHSEGAFAGVIHLADLDACGDVTAPAQALLHLARRFGEGAEAFISVSGLGGRFGLDAAPGERIGQVGALGFTKALAREWPTALVKTIDVDIQLAPMTVASALVDELFSGDRTPEVGFTRQGRVTVVLQQVSEQPGVELSRDSVVLVTGGATGLGNALARALAGRYGCTVALAGRSASDTVGKAIHAMKSAGARDCTYHMMDVRDDLSVNRAITAILGKHGRIDMLVHAASIRFDARIEKKKPAELNDVIDTKVLGARRLLDACGGLLQFAVFVGSWAGRFGNAGQTDYSAANDMLARLNIGLPFPALAIEFPPIEHSESTGRITAFRRAQMQEAGVSFLSEEEAATAFLDAVASANGQVLIGRSVPRRVFEARATFPVSRFNHVYLDSHVIGGQRVLPFAAAMDHVAAAALDVMGEREFTPFTISDFSIKRPVLVPDTTWLQVTVKAAQQAGGSTRADVTLSQDNVVCYRGGVFAAEDSRRVPIDPVPPAQLPISLREFYDRVTFHGPELQGIVSIDGLGADGISGTTRVSAPGEWINQPLRPAWTVDPLVIDCAFQLAAYWIWVKHGRTGFPLRFEEYTQVAPFGAGPVKCTARLESAEGEMFRGTLAWQDMDGRLLALMTGVTAEAKAHNARSTSASAKDVPGTHGASHSQSAAETPPDPSTYRFERLPEYQELKERLQFAETLGVMNPYFRVLEKVGDADARSRDRPIINFSSYNYINNSGDPVVSAAAKEAIERYGTSVSASRVASGERQLHKQLECELAAFLGTEACLVFTSGHATNVTVIGHIVGPEDLILHDELAHDSIIQGAKLSNAKRRSFPHNDADALDRALTALRPHYRRVLICIEGAYSMDGDIPDLPSFVALKKRHHAFLFVDEAHSIGVIGRTGRGIAEYHGAARDDVDIWMGTLSKAFASCGGYIGGNRALIEYLKYTTPGFVYSVGISPPNAAAALAALRQLIAHPERVTRLQIQSRKFLELLKSRGIDTGQSKDTAVVPAIIGDSVLCLTLADRLNSRGINVQPILYPAVAENAVRLRFFLSCEHTDEQLATTADILADELKRLREESARITRPVIGL
jgi:8-amino-7-oxononanoate synthase